MRAFYAVFLAFYASFAAAAADPGPCTAANAGPLKSDGKQRLVVGTGNTGGVFFPYGGGLARIGSAKLPRTEMTAEVTGGSVDNLKLLHKKEADLALTTLDSVYDAIRGEGAYKDVGKVPACAIAVLYESFIHVVALEGNGIRTVADMRGKRISVGSPGSSTEEVANRILAASGLDPAKDIKREFLSISESAAAMKDKKIDAFFWIGGLPTAAVTDLAATPGIALEFLDATGLYDAMVRQYGAVYGKLTLAKGTYPGLAKDVAGLGVANLVAVNASMPEALVRDLLRTLFDNAAEVQKVHPEAKSFALANAVKGSDTAPVPFHPGAIGFYREKSVWK
jgi:TRAP transporter TAXI family solute receptor